MKKKKNIGKVKTVQFGDHKIMAYVVNAKPTKKELKELEQLLKNHK